MPAPLAPTRLIEPGSHTPPRTAPTPDGLIDLRTVPLQPRPAEPRHLAVTAVGVRLGTEFEAREIPGPNAAPPGAVVITFVAANPPGPSPGLVTVVVQLSATGAPETVALWPWADSAWPEVARTSVVFAARHRARSTR
jgi:hypothetical protein